MERYEFIRNLGEGSFGVVFAALDKMTGQVVAIKKMKSHCSHPSSWRGEVRALCKLRHPNIVSLQAVVSQPYDNNAVSLVFEYMKGSLSQLIRLGINQRQAFSEAEIRSLLFQVLKGLSFMHDQNGYIHRDLKPDNLLVNQGVIKISDLGAARELKVGPPFEDYVTTRWYRAPEMLLRSFVYDEKVDMWAMGAIMAEMFLMRPLFQGDNWADQLVKICEVIGAPSKEIWWEGCLLAKQMNIQFPALSGVSIRAVMQPWASSDAINLMESLCAWDPKKRPSAAQALQHPFFTTTYIRRSTYTRSNSSLPARSRMLLSM